MSTTTRARLIATGAAALAAIATVATTSPAQAADTTTTFALTGGSLSISAPASVSLGTAATGASTVSGSLGSVTVTDARGALVATWTAAVSATNFTTGGATTAETIPKANITYTPGATTASSPVTGVFVPTAGTLGSTLNAYTGAAVGNNSATWNPTVSVSLPAQAVVGTYTATITHSVS